jgi:hypothetical protein
MRKALTTLTLLALFGLSTMSDPTQSVAQTDFTCQELNTGSAAETTAVRIRGAIVTAVRTSGASGGFWVQEPPTGGPGAAGDPFSGIFCYIGKNPTVSVGDSVTVVGMYEEYFEQSEVNMRDSFVLTGVDSSTTVHATGAVVPAYQKLTACDLTIDGATNVNQFPYEQWEGILVEVDSVRMKSDFTNGEWFYEEADGDSLCVGLADTAMADDKFPYQQPPVGIFVKFMRGVFDETYSEHKLQPRGDFDIVFDSYPAPAPEFAYTTDNTTIEIRWTYPLQASSAQTVTNYSNVTGGFTISSAVLVDSTLVRLTTTTQAGLAGSTTPTQIDIINVKNVNGTTMSPASVFLMAGVRTIAFVQEPKSVSNDSSRVAGYTACVAGVVTMGTSEVYNSTGGSFYIEQSGGGPKSGLRIQNTGNMASYARGDSVRVAGLISESFFRTQMGILDYRSAVLGSKPVPGPDVVTLATAKTEDYEGVLVRVNGPLHVADTWPGVLFNEIPTFAVPAGTDSFFINDNDGGGYAPFTSIDVNDTLNFVIGVMDTAFARRPILPRNSFDISLKGVTGVDEGTGTLPQRTKLYSNVPNPFNPKTTIRFALSKPGRTSLAIYDISGRQVRVLAQGEMPAGEHAKTWDGRDGDGRDVPSGIYFYKLATTGFEETRKMVLLK